MDQVGLRLEHVRLVVCTHAHADHCGDAAPIAARAGCEIWMHPNREHLLRAAEDPDTVLSRRIEVARHSGVPEEPLRRFAEAGKGGPAVATPLEVSRDLVPGVVVETDLGPWSVIETPGHAPSHVCLHQPERRLLLSGDHLLGRVSPYFDYGWTPDPVAEFVESLERVDALDARLALAGHGRPFTDVRGHVEANRALVDARLGAVRAALGQDGPMTAFDLARRVYAEGFTELTGRWLFSKTLCWLTHLERKGEAQRVVGEPERWA